jgi:molybdopterin synthase catalytic subunit
MLNNHGYSDVDWDAAKREATSILINIAKNKGRIAYSELVDQIQSVEIEAHDPRLFRLLDEISTEEDQAGRGMLSAIVVHKRGDMQPGPGFFELAKSLGKDTGNILECWICEFNRVHDYWANIKQHGDRK